MLKSEGAYIIVIFILYKIKFIFMYEIYFGEILSSIRISELACGAYQLIDFYVSYRGLN